MSGEGKEGWHSTWVELGLRREEYSQLRKSKEWKKSLPREAVGTL